MNNKLIASSIFLLTGIFIFIPIFIVKIISILILLLIAYHKISNTNQNSNKFFIASILFFIFALAYIFTPYWIIPQNMLINTILFIILAISGTIWAYYSSGKLNIKSNLNLKHYIWFAIIFLTIYIIQYNALNSSITSTGDESTHITGAKIITEFVLQIFRLISNIALSHKIIILLNILVILGISLILWIYLRKKFNKFKNIQALTWKRIIIAIFSVAIVGTYLIVYMYKNFFYQYIDDFLRYPFIVKFFQVIAIFPDQYNITLYRIIPFLSIIILSWMLFYKLTIILKNAFKKSIITNILAYLLTISITTIPIVYYYNSIVYIEMPMILLMTIVVLDIKTIITKEYTELITNPSWYALILLGFIKETAIIVIVPIIIARGYYKNIYLPYLSNNKITKKSLANKVLESIKKILPKEIGIYLLIILPIVTYLFFRIFFGNPRPYGGEIYNTLNILSYSSFLKGLIIDFGIILIIALIGFIILLKKDKIKAYSILFISTFISLFFICDMFIYIGYSRWNLFFVPIVIVLSITSIEFVISITKKYRNNKKSIGKYITLLLIIGVIIVSLISNIILMPIYIDGSRKNWGCVNCNYGDRTYPYTTTFSSLINQNIEHTIIIGITNIYIPNYPEAEFYTEKYHIKTNITIIGLNDISEINPTYNVNTLNNLIIAKNITLKRGDAILFLSADNEDPQFSDEIKYKKYSNTAYNIYLIRIN